MRNQTPQTVRAGGPIARILNPLPPRVRPYKASLATQIPPPAHRLQCGAWVTSSTKLSIQPKPRRVPRSPGTGEPISRTGMIRPLNFSSTVHSPRAPGGRLFCPAKNPCGGKSVTFCREDRSLSKCSSTELRFPSSGGLMLCRNDKRDFGSGLYLWAITARHMRRTFERHSAQICQTE